MSRAGPLWKSSYRVAPEENYDRRDVPSGDVMEKLQSADYETDGNRAAATRFTRSVETDESLFCRTPTPASTRRRHIEAFKDISVTTQKGRKEGQVGLLYML